jgi:hypothetical protein
MKELIEAHKHCTNNKQALITDDLCGCFYCLKIFNPEEIKSWTDFDKTAICPYCEIDSVIGKISGFPITDKFLRAMKEHWF